MSYPQQPGNWSDPSWSSQTPGYDPNQPPGYGPNQPPGYDPNQPPGYDPKSPYVDPSSAVPTSGQQASPAGYPAMAGYGGYPGYGYPVSPPTNGMAIAALVCAIAGVATCITAPVGAILGHVARRQIRERGEGGDGMALAAIIVGWILTGLLILLIIFYIVMIVLAVNAGPDYDDTEFLLRYLSALVG